MPITTDGHPPDFMPWMRRKSDYAALLHQIHRAFYDLNIEVDFVFPHAADFDGYKLLVVPALYVADDALLLRIVAFVKGGGHVLMTFKSGIADGNSRVRHVRPPGPLRQAAGFAYQEFSTLEHPLALKGNPFGVGDTDNRVLYWAEFLEPESAEPLAYYDHPFFSRWPAVTRNRHGNGSLTYIGTWPSRSILRRIAADLLRVAAISNGAHDVPDPVQVKSGTNRHGKVVRYFLNYSPEEHSLPYAYATGVDLTSGVEVRSGEALKLDPWGVAILEEV